MKALIHEIPGKRKQLCKVCGRKVQEKQSLENELHNCNEQYEKRKLQLQQAEIENKKKDEEIQRTKNKVIN